MHPSPYVRINPPTPYLMNTSQNQMQPPVPSGPLVHSGPLFQSTHLFHQPPRPPHSTASSSPKLVKPSPPPPPPVSMQRQPGLVVESPVSSTTFSIPQVHELTEDQKKLNHIKSEKKRRQIIRQGFGKLEYFLFEKQPGIHFTQQQQIKSRSEATMLKLTVEYIQHMIQSYKKEYLKYLKNQFILGSKTLQEVTLEMSRLQLDPTYNIHYKTQQKIRTYKRVVYNNNKSK